MRFAFVFLLAASLLFGQVPTVSKNVDESNRKQNPGKNESPVPPVSSIVSSVPSKPPTKPNTDKSQDPPQVTWWTYFCEAFGAPYLANWVLAVFAAGTAVAAIFTLRALKLQVRISRIALAAARAAVRKSAAGVQAALESNRLTAEAIVLSNPPKISVRGVHLDRGSLVADQTADGRFTIVNRGQTEAVIERIWANAMSGSPQKPLPYDQISEAIHASVSPGGELPYKFTSSSGTIPQGTIASFKNGHSQFHVMVFMLYTYGNEQNRISKRLVLCYSLNWQTGRFKRVTHPDLHR